MKKGMSAMGVVGLLMLILFLLISITTIIFYLENNAICRRSCIEKGRTSYEIIPNGEFFSTNDLCVCYNKSGIMMDYIQHEEQGDITFINEQESNQTFPYTYPLD